MSKQPRKACGRTGEPPLDSLNWMPAAEAHRLLTGLLGNGYLAAKVLTAAAADKRLPCMRCAIASRIAPDQDREIVALSIRFDFDHEKLRVWEWKDDAPVYYRGPADAAPVFGPADAAPLGAWVYCDAADAAFFVWRPKFEKIWPGVAAPAQARSSPAGIEAPPPRPRGSPRTHDWFSICGEIARRCVNPANGRVVVPEKENALVNKMLISLDDQNRARPAASEMAEAVRRVCAQLREVQR
jgi:hypothetical protein